MEQRFKIKTPYGEIIETIPGKNGPNDMLILSTFPSMPHAHSLCYIGHCVRIKGEVEERNYPVSDGYQGKGKLMAFLHACLYRPNSTIEQICIEHGIPLKTI